jgi:hypothetical protein
MNVSISLPSRTLLRNVDGKPVYIDWSKVPASVLPAILEGGAKIVLTNAFNSGGKDKTDGERLAQLEKRLAAFYRGEYVIAERGESAYTGMWNAYVDETRAETGCSVADCDKAKRAAITRVFGEKEKATTALFFKALATDIAKENDTDVSAELEAVESYYAGLAAKAAEQTAKAAAKIDVSGLAIARFKKAK